MGKNLEIGFVDRESDTMYILRTFFEFQLVDIFENSRTIYVFHDPGTGKRSYAMISEKPLPEEAITYSPWTCGEYENLSTDSRILAKAICVKYNKPLDSLFSDEKSERREIA